MIDLAERDGGSFRDPSGHVYEVNGEIYRTVTPSAKSEYESARTEGIFSDLISQDRLIGSVEVPEHEWIGTAVDASYLLKHERVPFISYPYEWSFSELKAAALHHLDIQLDLLRQDFVLSDASAYNVQFIGTKPIFIDILSVRRYREGEFWNAHRQFCQQFLNPLLLRSLLGVPHNSWFRGNLEGISTTDLSKLLSLRHKLSWNVLTHVALQAKLENGAISSPDAAIAKAKNVRRLSKAGYQGILTQLRKWIAKLHPLGTGKTVWGEYASHNTYSDTEASIKRNAIREFASKVRPNLLIDLGCNTGDYSSAALDGGAKAVIGFDFDQRAVDLAYSRARERGLNFLPLWLDAANPSPSQGWQQDERKGFIERAKADAMVALAFEHHLAIGRNIPLPSVVDWLVGIAPAGIIEFVPKNDSTVQKMLALRDDIFPNYNEIEFENELARRAVVVSKQVISQSGRTLFEYSR